MNSLLHFRRRQGFTLAELMVSSVIVVVILGFLFVTVDQTRKTINSTTAKVGQFQAARLAFDALTRNLSQATLQTYWDLDFDATTKNPVRYRRQADLHFVIDRGSALFPSAHDGAQNIPRNYPGHAVFFQAPLGFTAEQETTAGGKRKYRNLNNLLSNVGYFVEWREDKTLPDFIQSEPSLSQPKYRFRLMEVIQPGETNMIYNNSNYTKIPSVAVTPASPYTGPRDWIYAATGQVNLPTQLPDKTVAGTKQNAARVLAENVVALIIVPKKSERDRKPNMLNDLTGDKCVYDTRPLAAYKAQERAPVAGALALSDTEKKQLHQLPPIVQVTLVAIDEDSGARLQDHSTTAPDWLGGMFTKYTTETEFHNELGDVPEPPSDSLVYKLANPQRTLPTPRMNYRIFTADVVIRASKWTSVD
jgi:uncharacterized protein (TIGR02599 family)